MKCEFQASFYESNIFSRFAVNIFTAGNKKKKLFHMQMLVIAFVPIKSVILWMFAN